MWRRYHRRRRLREPEHPRSPPRRSRGLLRASLSRAPGRAPGRETLPSPHQVPDASSSTGVPTAPVTGRPGILREHGQPGVLRQHRGPGIREVAHAQPHHPQQRHHRRPAADAGSLVDLLDTRGGPGVAVLRRPARRPAAGPHGARGGHGRAGGGSGGPGPGDERPRGPHHERQRPPRPGGAARRCGDGRPHQRGPWPGGLADRGRHVPAPQRRLRGLQLGLRDAVPVAGGANHAGRRGQPAPWRLVLGHPWGGEPDPRPDSRRHRPDNLASAGPAPAAERQRRRRRAPAEHHPA